MNGELFNWPEEDEIPPAPPTYLCEECGYAFRDHIKGDVGNLYGPGALNSCVDYKGVHPQKSIISTVV